MSTEAKQEREIKSADKTKPERGKKAKEVFCTHSLSEDGLRDDARGVSKQSCICSPCCGLGKCLAWIAEPRGGCKSSRRTGQAPRQPWGQDLGTRVMSQEGAEKASRHRTQHRGKRCLVPRAGTWPPTLLVTGMKTRACPLQVIIKETNHLGQPHQGCAKQRRDVQVVGKRCTAALLLGGEAKLDGFVKLMTANEARPRQRGQRASPPAKARRHTSQPRVRPARCHGEKENKPVTTTRGKKINFQAQNTSTSCENNGTAMTKQEHKGAARKRDR